MTKMPLIKISTKTRNNSAGRDMKPKVKNDRNSVSSLTGSGIVARD
jgi:hypothetical protein